MGGSAEHWRGLQHLEPSTPGCPKKPEIPPECVYKYWQASASSEEILPHQITDAPALERDTKRTGKPDARPGFGPAMTEGGQNHQPVNRGACSAAF